MMRLVGQARLGLPRTHAHKAWCRLVVVGGGACCCMLVWDVQVALPTRGSAARVQVRMRRWVGRPVGCGQGVCSLACGGVMGVSCGAAGAPPGVAGAADRPSGLRLNARRWRRGSGLHDSGRTEGPHHYCNYNSVLPCSPPSLPSSHPQRTGAWSRVSHSEPAPPLHLGPASRPTPPPTALPGGRGAWIDGRPAGHWADEMCMHRPMHTCTGGAAGRLTWAAAAAGRTACAAAPPVLPACKAAPHTGARGRGEGGRGSATGLEGGEPALRHGLFLVVRHACLLPLQPYPYPCHPKPGRTLAPAAARRSTAPGQKAAAKRRPLAAARTRSEVRSGATARPPASAAAPG